VRLRDAARSGDLAAVQARPPASAGLRLVLNNPHARRLQRLLAEHAGRAAVNAKDAHGYAPVGRFPTHRHFAATARTRECALCRCPRKSQACQGVSFASRSFHAPPWMHPCTSAVTLASMRTQVQYSPIDARPRMRTFPLTRADGSRCGVCASSIRRRNTPLHHAAVFGHTDVVAALLTHGANVHAKEQMGCVLPVATLGNGRRAPRRPCPRGQDSCIADRDAQTNARAMHSRTHARIDVGVCMRLDTRTDARTTAHARTRDACATLARWQLDTHSRTHPHARTSSLSSNAHTPRARTHSRAHTHART
jgi:hypothetical protein